MEVDGSGAGSHGGAYLQDLGAGLIRIRGLGWLPMISHGTELGEMCV